MPLMRLLSAVLILVLVGPASASAGDVRVPRDSPVVIHGWVHQPGGTGSRSVGTEPRVKSSASSGSCETAVGLDPGYRPLYIPGSWCWDGSRSVWVPGRWVF